MCRRSIALDPEKYFIIIPNMLGNSLSSSPSNMTPSDREIRREEIAARHRLVDGGTTNISLGRTFSRHGRAHRAVLRVSQVLAPQLRVPRRREGAANGRRCAFNGGWYKDQPTKGLRAMARVYAGWGFSQAFYRERLDIESLGYSRWKISSSGFGKASFCRRMPITC
jgi:homoserine O-acetyltransferase